MNLNFVDNFLNNITMYRLTLYYLIALVLSAMVLSIFGLLSFGFFSLLFSVFVLLFFGWFTNKIFAIFFDVSTNFESVYITLLILSLVLTPIKNFEDVQFFAWAAIAAISSKFIFVINRRHLFNPAAFGMFAATIATTAGARWWVGTSWMLPTVLIGGLLIVRKVRKVDMILSFLAVAIAVILGTSLAKGSDFILTVKRIFFDSPILFFAFVMLTEPFTTPAKKTLQAMYGALVGFLFAPQVHLGSLYTTPEIALLIGNVFSYVVSPTKRLLLTLVEKIQIAPDMYDFIFSADSKLAYDAGQYLEWTVPHEEIDNRGMRRYFTLSSSPTEPDLRMGVKFYQNSSTFKRALISLKIGQQIFAGQLSGEFTLPA